MLPRTWFGANSQLTGHVRVCAPYTRIRYRADMPRPRAHPARPRPLRPRPAEPAPRLLPCGVPSDRRAAPAAPQRTQPPTRYPRSRAESTQRPSGVPNVPGAGAPACEDFLYRIEAAGTRRGAGRRRRRRSTPTKAPGRWPGRVAPAGPDPFLGCQWFAGVHRFGVVAAQFGILRTPSAGR